MGFKEKLQEWFGVIEDKDVREVLVTEYETIYIVRDKSEYFLVRVFRMGDGYAISIDEKTPVQCDILSLLEKFIKKYEKVTK